MLGSINGKYSTEVIFEEQGVVVTVGGLDQRANNIIFFLNGLDQDRGPWLVRLRLASESKGPELE